MLVLLRILLSHVHEQNNKEDCSVAARLLSVIAFVNHIIIYVFQGRRTKIILMG